MIGQKISGMHLSLTGAKTGKTIHKKTLLPLRGSNVFS
jgi:hypothetical protein